MKMLVVGIGDVAKKAYLPVYAGLKNVNVYLVSRDEQKLQDIISTYRFEKGYTDLQDVPMTQIDAVMIHSTTAAHYEQAEYCLRKGKHVFIDKPITFKLEETERLVALAKENGVHLVTGFNRRFATATEALKQVEQKNMILIQKNRTYKPATLREFIIEDFVHVVDTLRYLTDLQTVERLSVTPRYEGDTLKQVMIHFQAGGIEAIGWMNRDNGCTEEVMEVMSPSVKRVTRDVERVIDYGVDGVKEWPLDPWESNLKRRGFIDLIDDFIKLLNGEANKSVLAEDSLETHRLCEEILKNVQ
ncbi:Gfo/Idh/MocA family oxidoreductase [Exiguobacterium sp. MMG028]|uniref:Gfo/Idh/MocA family protein n=1 Tax=Exiguobacterium sp. MMG028 TaxID=3021979 RepID=UPI0022FDFBFD|nr:Gfo/Idh/MocA family oxidoreductase [Exiguobacterium sp. MMG028]MDA5559691.1 Gfo/Idh/MocA family oxidoreductase [Exiguobacterium sp. MMG028]